MKTITIKIPINIAEIKAMFKMKTDKKFVNNVKVVHDTCDESLQELKHILTREPIPEANRNYIYNEFSNALDRVKRKYQNKIK